MTLPPFFIRSAAELGSTFWRMWSEAAINRPVIDTVCRTETIMSALFIPDRIRVGFQERKDTYTNRLAYVIYWDKTGKLRKEKSWQTWRDDQIKPEEFDNTPQDGFILNKGIERYNWSHYGSGRSYIRIYDSRGIEFEITPENLIGILTETNCSRRGLEGEFVYAWKGTDLVLLPCCSEEYQKACVYTALQGKKISAHDLKEGCSYTTKKGEEVIYMGRCSWFQWTTGASRDRFSQRKHVFAYLTRPKHPWNDDVIMTRFFPKNDATFLAELNNPDPVGNYPQLVEEFQGDIHSSVVVSWECKPARLPQSVFTWKKDRWGHKKLARTAYMEKIDKDTIQFWNLITVLSTRRRFGSLQPESDNEIRGYQLRKAGRLNIKNLTIKRKDNDLYYYYGDDSYDTGPVLTEQQVLDRLATFIDVSMVLTSGKKLRVKNVGMLYEDS